jgi:hypothetical protein
LAKIKAKLEKMSLAVVKHPSTDNRVQYSTVDDDDDW